jgi:hypothetical protein
MYLLCTYVGPVHPADFLRTRWHPRPKAGPSAVIGPAETIGGPPFIEVERFLRQVEQNLTALTRTVPMAEIEDVPPMMQTHVVGVPWTWVQLLWHLANVVFHYSRANRPHP